MGKLMLNDISYSGGDGEQFQPIIYSETEREVGVWLDGKPLYEQTIYCDTFPNNTSKDLSTPSDIDLLIDSFGFMKSTTLTGYFRTLPFAAGGSNDVRVDLNAGTLRVVTFSDWSNYTGYITIRYTKTTDAPGSGTWTPQGVPSHHYSTSEHIVGTWIDGKTLYEKTVNFGALPDTTTKTVAHNISNVEHVWIYEGWAQNNVNGFTNMLSLATNSLNNQWYFGVDPTQIQCWAGSNRTVYDTCYVVLHYTKADT